MNKEKIDKSEMKQNNRDYFSTPVTTIGNQKQVSKYSDSFDPHVKSYSGTGTRPITKKYVIKQS